MIQVPKDAPSLGPSNDKLPRGEWTANKVAQEIGRKNVRFAKLPPEQKRVVVAKDVIEWLDAKKLVAAGQNGGSEYIRIIPVEGVAVERDGGYARPLSPEHVADSGDVVNGDACVACGIGALVATAAERGVCNLSTFTRGQDENTPSRIHDALSPVFDAKQLALIEYAFELGSGLGPALRAGHLKDLLSFDERDQVLKWASTKGVDTGSDVRERRLRAIMQNIIDNKGTFIP